MGTSIRSPGKEVEIAFVVVENERADSVEKFGIAEKVGIVEMVDIAASR